MSQRIKPVILKNPGCEYCRFFLPPVAKQEDEPRPACLLGAQKIFQQGLPFVQLKKWKWIDCAYAGEKNKNRLCEDFRVYSITRRLLSRFILFLQRGGQQLPPTFAREIWWNTED